MNQNKTTTTDITANHALVQKRINTLNGLKPFSLEPCGTLKGANLINDSAATSIEKVAESFVQFENPIIWITEANDDNENYDLIRFLVKTKVKVVIAVGEFADNLHNELAEELKFFIAANSWEEALQMSKIVANKKDIILFSPGCRASEPFENYKERGEYWNKIVQLNMEVE